MHGFAKMLIQENMLKIKHFLLKIGFNKPTFVRTLRNFDFRCTLISVKLLVFGVKTFSKKCISCY